MIRALEGPWCPVLSASCIALALLVGCSTSESPAPVLAQGVMAGEATATSILLQTRLARGPGMNSEHRSPGVSGFVAFEISTHEDFASSRTTDTAAAEEERDFIVRTRVANLEAGARYYYRPLYGSVATGLSAGPTGSFRTLGGAGSTSPVSLALVTCPNYYHFHHGNYDAGAAYEGPDKALGYPALEAIREARPDYVVWNGDNVYYDHPARENVLEARDQGLDVDLSPFGGRAVVDLDGMRRKFHEQFAQPRYHRLWAVAASYYLKDDHDYRVNDGFPDMEYRLAHEL